MNNSFDKNLWVGFWVAILLSLSGMFIGSLIDSKTKGSLLVNRQESICLTGNDVEKKRCLFIASLRAANIFEEETGLVVRSIDIQY